MLFSIRAILTTHGRARSGTRSSPRCFPARRCWSRRVFSRGVSRREARAEYSTSSGAGLSTCRFRSRTRSMQWTALSASIATCPCRSRMRAWSGCPSCTTPVRSSPWTETSRSIAGAGGSGFRFFLPAAIHVNQNGQSVQDRKADQSMSSQGSAAWGAVRESGIPPEVRVYGSCTSSITPLPLTPPAH